MTIEAQTLHLAASLRNFDQKSPVPTVPVEVCT
jgi:hypothetical protein